MVKFKDSLDTILSRAFAWPTHKNLQEALDACHSTIGIQRDTITNQENVIRDLENSKLTNQKKESTHMTQMTHVQPSNTIDVPIDLGMGYVVMIKGLPGRPSVAACERLCKVIMAYAVLPQTLSAENVGQEIIESMNRDLKSSLEPEFDFTHKPTKGK